MGSVLVQPTQRGSTSSTADERKIRWEDDTKIERYLGAKDAEAAIAHAAAATNVSMFVVIRCLTSRGFARRAPIWFFERAPHTELAKCSGAVRKSRRLHWAAEFQRLPARAPPRQLLG